MRKWLRALWRVLTAPFRLLFWVIAAPFRLLRGFFKEFVIAEPDEDVPILDTFQKAVENPRGLLEHLDALRKHLLRAVLALIATTAAAFAFTPQVMDWLAQPIGGIEELQAIEVTEPIGVVMRVALLGGFSVALPYIAFELLRFAAPALSRRGRITGLFAIPLTAVFFAGGMAFAYYLMLPTALPVLLNFMGIPTLPRPASYLRFVTGLMFWVGVAFEFPLASYVLAAMGIVNARTLRQQWRIAVVILAVLAAAITPTIDPVNMLLVLLPLIVLYFLGVGMAYLAQIRRRARSA